MSWNVKGFNVLLRK